MAWWSRRRPLPPGVEREWRGSLPATAPHRVLAATATSAGWVVASVALLSVRTDAWTHTGWHEIEHGQWNDELSRLQWTRVDRHRGSVSLADPGRLPAVFRERVKASIVYQQTVPVNEAAGIVISARRDLADPQAPLEWHATLQRGLTWHQPGVRALADSALARSRLEFDPG